jgi:hypothetical protein
MKTITVVTFKGCQSAMDFKDELDEQIDENELSIQVEFSFVPTPKQAEAMSLYGSPTILVEGEIYAQDEHAVPGFY